MAIRIFASVPDQDRINKKFTVNSAAYYALRRWCKRIVFRKYVRLFWSKSQTPNWGDALSPVLCSLVSGRPCRFEDGIQSEKFLAIGSILSHADYRAEVWGSGFIKEDDVVVAPPRAIHAVRGPLTRERLLNLGIQTPEVYGDPALLISRYTPALSADHPRYRLGIVPHYEDRFHPSLRRFRNDPSCLIVDVTQDVWSYIDQIRCCNLIWSSSLHGLICADAFGVPSVWIEFSDRVIGKGFKFRDYFLSVGRLQMNPVRLTCGVSVARIERDVHPGTLAIDVELLLRTCPFRRRGMPSLHDGNGGVPQRESVANSDGQVHKVKDNF